MKMQINDIRAEFEYFIDLLIDGEKTVKQFDPLQDDDSILQPR